MTPIQAAQEYYRLEASSLSLAIAFAHAYEDKASSEEFSAYLDALEYAQEKREYDTANAARDYSLTGTDAI